MVYANFLYDVASSKVYIYCEAYLSILFRDYLFILEDDTENAGRRRPQNCYHEFFIAFVARTCPS